MFWPSAWQKGILPTEVEGGANRADRYKWSDMGPHVKWVLWIGKWCLFHPQKWSYTVMGPYL